MLVSTTLARDEIPVCIGLRLYLPEGWTSNIDRCGAAGVPLTVSAQPKWRIALDEIDRYLASQSAWLVNYAERHHAGQRVGTAITEGTANFLVNRRMNKEQQMRWSRRGADLLLQVRCAVINGKLGSGLGQLFEAEAEANSISGLTLAA